MSIKVTTNQVNLGNQFENGFSQTQDQKRKEKVIDESRFILMKANQLSALSKLGLSCDVSREIVMLCDKDGGGCCPMIRECDYYNSCPNER